MPNPAQPAEPAASGLPGVLPDTQVRAMFDRIARVYDVMNSVMTAGMHHRWRERAADLARQRDVLGLLGVDAQPAVVGDAVLRGPFRLHFREMMEVVPEARCRTRCVELFGKRPGAGVGDKA